ncbi:class A beta-lactamase [Yonghaparkia sp. Soil809]|uniref:class A beta-lactamase n=1 Tax=Yonghaparkia sp. Soil809 TaxID=1736417 RepID=UPI0006FB88D2|nr:class A beta-lactamase [Yonghaparkia sp. Soil809]KRF31492.1 class A beta-lactamase [Yonghaparkia sp. Soil809]
MQTRRTARRAPQTVRATTAGLAALVLLVGSGCSAVGIGGAPTPSPSAPVAAEPSPTIDLDDDLADLEGEYDARVGVYAVDTGSGETVAYREDERFAYASTFKALLAAVVLKTVDDLDRVITYSADELVDYSPVTEQNVDGGMSIRELAEATVRTSDNSAANLLLDELGGPAGFADALTRVGDRTTQPERRETELNTAVPGETRDTSTPRALAETLRGFALDGLLDDTQAATLIDWMSGNATGDPLIRAGAPEGWAVADKSGAGGYGTRNDLGIVWPPDGDPIVIAVLTTRDAADAEYDNALVADVAAVVLEELG